MSYIREKIAHSAYPGPDYSVDLVRRDGKWTVQICVSEPHDTTSVEFTAEQARRLADQIRSAADKLDAKTD